MQTAHLYRVKVTNHKLNSLPLVCAIGLYMFR